MRNMKKTKATKLPKNDRKTVKKPTKKGAVAPKKAAPRAAPRAPRALPLAIPQGSPFGPPAATRPPVPPPFPKMLPVPAGSRALLAPEAATAVSAAGASSLPTWIALETLGHLAFPPELNNDPNQQFMDQLFQQTLSTPAEPRVPSASEIPESLRASERRQRLLESINKIRDARSPLEESIGKIADQVAAEEADPDAIRAAAREQLENTRRKAEDLRVKQRLNERSQSRRQTKVKRPDTQVESLRDLRRIEQRLRMRENLKRGN